MVEEWLTISELAKRIGLAENTARRYATLFGEYLKSRSFGRATKYTSDATEVLGRIAGYYQQGLSTHEIHERFHDLPKTVDMEAKAEQPPPTTTTPPPQQWQRLMEFMQHQEQFNRELLNRLDAQQQYIDQSIRIRDEKLMEALREIRDGRLAIAAAQENKKPWWKWW